MAVSGDGGKGSKSYNWPPGLGEFPRSIGLDAGSSGGARLAEIRR